MLTKLSRSASSTVWSSVRDKFNVAGSEQAEDSGLSSLQDRRQ